MQTDASISPGNSGGRLFGGDGRPRGVVDSKMTGDGVDNIAFAVLVGPALVALDVHLGASTDAKIEVVRKGPRHAAIPAPLVKNRPANAKAPPMRSDCKGVVVTDDSFAGVSHLRGKVGGVNLVYDRGTPRH